MCRVSLVRWFRAVAFLGSIAFAIAALPGQDEPIPYSDWKPNAFETRTGGYWRLDRAERALKSGMYELAGAYAGEALANGNVESELDRDRLVLIQIDSLLGRGLAEEASTVIDEAIESESIRDALNLRLALVALAREDESATARALERVDETNLDPGERAWNALAHGWLDLRSGDQASAEIEFESARSRARELSPALHSQLAFLAFRYQLEFDSGALSLADLREAYDSNRGSETGYRFAQLLAVALAEQGRNQEAIGLLVASIEGVPEAYGNFRDEILLLQTLIAGLDEESGRSAARRLVVEGEVTRLQRIALQQLMEEGLDGDTAIAETLQSVLDEVIDGAPGHALTAEALYYRSVGNFHRGDSVAVENDGYRLIEEYPNSEYKQGVLTLLASSSWQRSRYRTAASLLTQVRTEFESNIDRDRLNILIADCYYRAGDQADNEGDFSDAADAYRVALDGELNEEESSQVFFQLVLSHLNAGELAEAKLVLDDPDLSRRANSDTVWQAEWTLVKQMRQRDESIDAYERINSFVSLEGLSLGLQVKMFWLGAKLSYESELYGETQVWVDRLSALLENIGETEHLRNVESDVLLTLAESLLKEGESDASFEAAGLEILGRVRDEFGDTESAQRSFLVEARHLSDKDLVVESSQLLNRLVDANPDSKFAPLALYEIALNAEKRGQGYLNQAVNILDRIAKEYPDSEIAYYARLKQGNLARMLNEFETAELVYRSLENTYRERPDRYLAQIALADTLIARSSEDPAKFEAGISRLEYLMDLPNLPIELRIEAGYKIGTAWENQGEQLKAKSAYFSLYDFWIAEELRVERLGVKGRYWLSRSLFEIAEIYQSEANLDRAVEFYEKIESLNLHGAELARARIEQLRGRSPFANQL